MKPNKPKILLVLPLPPPMHGSNLMNQYVSDCELLKEKYDVKILPLHYAKDITDLGSMRPQKFLNLARYIFSLIHLMFSFRPQLVYFVPAVTGFPFYRDCLFALIFKLFPCKVIYHLHGYGIRQKINSRAQLWLYKWFFKKTTVIHLSRLLYDDIKEVITKEQCRFLANGIKDPFPEFAARKKPVNPKPVILFLSNLHESKGPLLLLNAYQQLKKDGKKFIVYFVGNPSSTISEERFKALIKEKELENHVKYLGPKYGEEKDEILLNSDILVFPTTKDTFPLVLLEAMAAGLPVVSTLEGAIPEIVDDGVTGFLVEPQNEKQLAEKIAYLIDNPDKAQQMGIAGRKKFEREYNLEVFHQRLVAVFDEVLRTKF